MIGDDVKKGFPCFPKIYAIGSKYISNIWDKEVEITAKVDGSQLAVGVIDNKLRIRSKGKEIIHDAPEKMFKIGVDWAIANKDKIASLRENDTDNIVIYGEYLNKPKHNTICYDRVPKHNFIVFGVMINGILVNSYDKIKEYADRLDLETVALLYSGKINDATPLEELLDTDDVLGGSKIEGFVVKNYDSLAQIGGRTDACFGKYVSEKFKEKHKRVWNRTQGKGKLETLLESYRTEARWHKAIQHLRDNGEIIYDPSDIGKLIKEIQRDLCEEEEDNIKEQLWKIHKNEFIRKVIAGFPEWYKDQLVNNSFGGEE